MIPLEDNFADVLGKAMTGLGLDKQTAATKAALDMAQVQALLGGEFSAEAARKLSTVLHLRPDALARLASGEYRPKPPEAANIAQVGTSFGDMAVNSYLLWDPQNLAAVIFDTGADAAALLDIVERENLDVAAIFLTHSHPDHIHALTKLKKALGTDAWSSEHEPVRGTRLFRPGDLFNAGRHFIRTRHTPGHSPGGATFVIEGHLLSAAIVGDAVFAGSVGGIRESMYSAALEAIQREILSLPDQTILCPGHGPMTTVGQEKENNPFF